jgi:hypothetical protein
MVYTHECVSYLTIIYTYSILFDMNKSQVIIYLVFRTGLTIAKEIVDLYVTKG